MSRIPGPLRHDPLSEAISSRTPGPLGYCDAADPYCDADIGDTPGTLGRNDYSQWLADAGNTIVPVRKGRRGRMPGDGRIPTSKELDLLTDAQRTAIKWCDTVVTRLSEVNRFVLGSGDPRTYPPHVPTVLASFEAHFKSRAARDIHEVADNYTTIRKFLMALGKKSYRVVPNEKVDEPADGEPPDGEPPGIGDVYAYVFGRDPVIYVAERAFGVGPATAQSKTVRGKRIVQITVGPRELNQNQRVRLLIHEAAHASLGVKHSGGKSGFDLEACGTGVPNITTYAQASQNAYCYDLFAFCASQ